jgi:hypothetical protein
MNGPATGGKTHFDQRRRLLVVPDARRRIDEVDQVLDELLAHGRPCVLYVHGRGDEPRKSFEKRILEKLEAEYGVKVLMFLWDANARLLHRPVAMARAAAPHLRELVERIARYRENRPHSRTFPISLLVHSMGAIVLRAALEGCPLAGPAGPLFTNILLTGADEEDEGHPAWIERLHARATILITLNRHDLVLRLSRHESGRRPLGRGPMPSLAANAYYLEMTGLVGFAHQVFTTRSLRGQPAVREILAAMLRGDELDLVSARTVARVERERILIPQARRPGLWRSLFRNPAFSSQG